MSEVTSFCCWLSNINLNLFKCAQKTVPATITPQIECGHRRVIFSHRTAVGNNFYNPWTGPHPNPQFVKTAEWRNVNRSANFVSRAQELCGNQGDRPWLPVPFGPCGLCGCKATLNSNLTLSGGNLQKVKTVKSRKLFEGCCVEMT